MTIIATGVRRQTVTVLFVDIVGFTALVDELDCAEVRALQVDYFAAVSAVVRDCGGVVEKYVGDAVMAVFGAVVAVPGGGRRGGGPGRAADPGGTPGAPPGGRFRVRTRVGLATGDVIVDLAAARDGGFGDGQRQRGQHGGAAAGVRAARHRGGLRDHPGGHRRARSRTRSCRRSRWPASRTRWTCGGRCTRSGAGGAWSALRRECRVMRSPDVRRWLDGSTVSWLTSRALSSSGASAPTPARLPELSYPPGRLAAS